MPCGVRYFFMSGDKASLKGGYLMANVEAKAKIVEEIKAKIQASKSVVLADYNKLTVL